MNINLYQIWYDEHSKPDEDSGFLAFDCRYNPEFLKREIAHLIRFCDEIVEKASSDDYFALLSPRFYEKTGLTAHNVKDFVLKNPNQDVYLFNPYPMNVYLYLNVWEQGEENHAGLKELTQKLFDKANFDFDVYSQHRNDIYSTVYCNYWLASKDFFLNFVNFIKHLDNTIENMSEKEKQLYFSETTYFRTTAVFYPFIFERLICTYLLINQNWRAKPYPPPTVSIIIPYYNCKDYIEQTLQSIENQTYPHYEIILVNDGSDKTNTAFIEKLLETKPNVKYIYQENKGLSSARNSGGRIAKGDYILFLDSDDLLHKEYLQKTISAFQSNPMCKLVYTKAELFEAQTGEWKLPPYQGFKSLLQGNMIYCTALHRKSDFDRLQGFDKNLKAYEDWDYWIRLLQDGGEVIRLDEILFSYRKRNSGNSMTDEIIINVDKGRDIYQKLYTKNIDIFLKYELGYYDFCSLMREYQHIQQNYSKLNNDLPLSGNTLILNKKTKTNNLFILKMMKPFIKFEQALHSLNRYRKAFFALAKNKGSISSAVSSINEIYQQHGFYKAKNFLRIQHHSFDFYGIDKSEFERLSTPPTISNVSESNFHLSDGIIILTTMFTYYVAVLIKDKLIKANIECEIIFEQPPLGYQNKWHIVICPHVFPYLPKNYIAFQMEQSVSSRWFNQEYFNRLHQAKFVFDYSKVNIEFLKQNAIASNKLYYIPVGTLTHSIDDKNQHDNRFDYEVAFYGDPNCDRRQRFLTELQKHFSVKVICNVFGDELYQLLRKSKIIVNIHYYENALLETTRLYECLSLNKAIVSEVGSDQQYHEELNDVIEFVPIDDVDLMVEKIKSLLNDSNHFNDKVNKIHQINAKKSKFDQYFYQFLLDENALTKETFDKLLTE